MLIASYLTEIRVVKIVTLKIVKVLIYRQLRSTCLFCLPWLGKIIILVS